MSPHLRLLYAVIAPFGVHWKYRVVSSGIALHIQQNDESSADLADQPRPRLQRVHHRAGVGSIQHNEWCTTAWIKLSRHCNTLVSTLRRARDAENVYSGCVEEWQLANYSGVVGSARTDRCRATDIFDPISGVLW